MSFFIYRRNGFSTSRYANEDMENTDIILLTVSQLA